MEIKIGQIYRFKHQAFQGDVFLYDARDPETDAQLVTLATLEGGLNAALRKNVFQVVSERFFDTYPTDADNLGMEARLAAVNHEFQTLYFNPTHSTEIKSFGFALLEVAGDTLACATSGAAQVVIFREGQMLKVSTDSPSENIGKTFPQYTAGKLQTGDTVLVCTKNLFNYLSTSRLSQIFKKYAGQEAADQILDTLKELAPVAEAALGLVLSIQETERENSAQLLPKTKKYYKIWQINKIWSSFWQARKIRFYLLIALGIAALSLTIYYVSQSAGSRNIQTNQTTASAKLDYIEKQLTAGEAALIYKDKAKVQSVINEVGPLLAATSSLASEDSSSGIRWLNLKKRYKDLNDKLQALSNKNK